MLKLKTLIVDDEDEIRSHLRSILDKMGRIEIVEEAHSGEQALEMVKRSQYDLVFLDIKMPNLSGVEVADKLRAFDTSPLIIFVAEDEKYAVQAFELDAIDYLMKPLDAERVFRAIQKACNCMRIKSRIIPDVKGHPPKGITEETIHIPEDSFDENSLIQAIKSVWSWDKSRKKAKPEVRLKRLPVDKRGRTLLISYDSIIFAEAWQDCSYVHTAEETFLTSFSLKGLEERLDDSRFFRAHRKFLVNLDQVTEILSMPGGNLLLRTKGKRKVEIPISRRRVKELKSIVGL
jgi:DNA-binding LytR/AlgR family response regulator